MIMLCADDYGLAEGVSRGIIELAEARRLSAVSAMVTFERWREDGPRLDAVRAHTAAGLHLNLTLGRPLVQRAGTGHLGGEGQFLALRELGRRAVVWKLTGGRMQAMLNVDDLRAECRAQIEAFVEATGALPDFIDGHQHVHALPHIRDALIGAIREFAWPEPPLVRVPSNAGTWLLGPHHEWAKRTIVAEVTRGARRQLHDAGLPTNDTFSGFSSFALGADYRPELETALAGAATSHGSCHLVMCHPGHVDDELRACGDPVVGRRSEEFRGIMTLEGLPERIWHAQRDGDGNIDWAKARAA